MPDEGEIRSYQGETRRWDGQAWRLVPQSSPLTASDSSTYAGGAWKGVKDFARELATGQGTARQDSLERAKSAYTELAKGLNPLNIPIAAYNLVRHPIDTATGIVDTAERAASGDPKAIGQIGGAYITGRMAPVYTRGLNRVAASVAQDPRAAGYIAGAGAGIATGAHPFIFGRIGQAMSGALRGPASAVERGTGAILDAVGGRDAATGLSDAERSQLAKQGYSPEIIDRIEASASTPREIAPQTAPMSPMPTRAAVKPNYSAADYVQIRALMKQGLTQDQAVRTLALHKSSSFSGLPSDADVATDVAVKNARTQQ